MDQVLERALDRPPGASPQPSGKEPVTYAH
jgi:hypothetical protein